MIDTLRKCYLYETGERKDPCGFDDVKHSLAGLIGRGLIRTDRVRINGKEVTGFFVTEEGKAMIKKHES